MTVTRLERKARRNKARAKERTLLLKRNVKRIQIKSAYKEESGIILEDDVLTIAAKIEAAAKVAPAPKKAPKVEEVAEAAAVKPKTAKKTKATEAKAEAEPKATKTAKPKVTKTVKAKATKTVKPKKTIAADKLNKIEGIGPKIASVLNDGGITSFSLLAGSTAKKIREILDNAEGNFAAHNPTTWPKKAKLAAAGKWDELKALQVELDGGK